MVWKYIKRFRYHLLLFALLAFIRLHLPGYEGNKIPQVISRVESTNYLEEKFPDREGGSSDSVVDGNIGTWWFGNTSKGHPSELNLYFQKGSKFNHIEIFFPFDPAKTFSVDSQDTKNHSWTNVIKIDNNSLSKVDLRINDSNPDTEAIRISFLESQNNLVAVGEVRAYHQPHQSILGKTIQQIFVVRRTPLSYLYYLLIILLVTITIGFGTSRKKVRKITPLSLAMIWTRGIVMLSLLGVVRVLLGPKIRIEYFLIGLFLVSLYRSLRLRIHVPKNTKLVTLLLFIFLSNLTFFYYFKDQYPDSLVQKTDIQYDMTTFFPTPYGLWQTDFTIPYGVAKIWMYKLSATNPQAIGDMAGYKISDRTPLLTLYSLPFFGLLGDRLFTFEIVSISISPMFILGFYILLQKLFGKKVAIFSAIILTFNHWIFFAAHFGQVRLLTIFFIAMFLYFAIRLKNKRSAKYAELSSYCATLAFLSHPFALAYIFPILIYHLFSFSNMSKPELTKLMIKTYALPMIAFILWTIWARTESGTSLLTSSMISGSWDNANKMMHSLKGIDNKNYWNIIEAKLHNFLGIFLPNPRNSVIRSYGPIRTMLAPALGLSLVPFVILSFFCSPSRLKKLVLSYSLFVIFITTFVFLSFYAILGLNWYHIGLIPLFIGSGVSFILTLPKWGQLVVIFSAIAEFYYISYFFFPIEAGKNLSLFLKNQELGPIVIGAILIVQTAAIVFIWYQTTHNRTKGITDKKT